MDANTSVPAPGPAPKPALKFYAADSYLREESIGYMMRRILSMAAMEVEREFGASDLTNAQWVPLLKLHVGSATTVAELARECELDAGAMTRLLDRIEAKGLCRRVRSSKDRRVVNIELTDAGRNVAKDIPAALCRAQNAHLEGFSQEEWNTLKSFLKRILDNAMAIQAARKTEAPLTRSTPFLHSDSP